MEYRKLSTLKKLEGNPRIIRDKHFKNICDSIRDNPKYFEARPLILSDRTGKLIIIAGNQRYEAARMLKLKEVPTFLMEGITEEKEKEITIRDNTQQGEWDWDLLSGWDDLPLIDWGIKGIDDEESIKPTLDYEEKELRPYKMSHVLLSFPPEKLLEIQKHLEKIIKIEGVEYEQASN